jgi:hypothetical protein
MVRQRVFKTIAAILAFILFGAVIVLTPDGPARAHGEANWIMEHPDYGWCCGPKDCSRIKAEEVRIDDEFYVAERHALRWPVLGTFKSIDHHYWICIFMRGTSMEQIKCFFAPMPPAI